MDQGRFSWFTSLDRGASPITLTGVHLQEKQLRQVRRPHGLRPLCTGKRGNGNRLAVLQEIFQAGEWLATSYDECRNRLSAW